MVIGQGEVEVSTGLSLRTIRETGRHAFALGCFAFVDLHQLKSGIPCQLAGLGHLQQGAWGALFAGLLGLYLGLCYLKFRDLHALAWAHACPAAQWCTVEVRPLAPCFVV